ncbi:hypothetical protein, partial [Mesomycoplasma ovipneumoniae]
KEPAPTTPKEPAPTTPKEPAPTAPNEQPQTNESAKSQSTITLKAFAVFDHPDFTRGKTSRARQEITEAFIDSYIKK